MTLAPSDRDLIALGVQQPWAELIVRGVKTVEVRSTSARVRGPVLIYASRRPSTLADANTAAAKFGLVFESLPRGVVVGKAELVESRRAMPEDSPAACVGPTLLAGRFAWRLTAAERFAEPVEPRFLPFGIWFYPFRRRGGSR